MQDFSLATAIVLGCCSFESYNAPYRSFGLKEVSPCKTETIYMDQDFLSDQICGMLEVCFLIEALQQAKPCINVDG